MTRYLVSEAEVDMTAIRAQGAGGQNVNKVSSAIHLRFAIHLSNLPQEHKDRLLALNDGRITEGGVIIIKAQQHRTQEMNRADALERLQQLVDRAAQAPRLRRASTPSYGAKQRRLKAKSIRSGVKANRQYKVTD
jgi:ribosome-associated protein